MNTFLKAFSIGIGIILGAFLFMFLATLVLMAQSGNEPSLYRGMHMFVTGWFVTVLICIPAGSLPLTGTWGALCARWFFVWIPTILGWYLFFKVGGPFLVIGMLVSSTFVGYNIVANYYKVSAKKKSE